MAMLNNQRVTWSVHLRSETFIPDLDHWIRPTTSGELKWQTKCYHVPFLEVLAAPQTSKYIYIYIGQDFSRNLHIFIFLQLYYWMRWLKEVIDSCGCRRSLDLQKFHQRPRNISSCFALKASQRFTNSSWRIVTQVAMVTQRFNWYW